MWRSVVVLLACASCATPSPEPRVSSPPGTIPEADTKDVPPIEEQQGPVAGFSVVFEGMCDASGAIPLDARRFAVADDEDNLIRVYDAERGGAPLEAMAIAGLDETQDEIDLEAATRLGEYGVWLASHGRTKTGARADTRVNLLLSTAPQPSAPLRLVGSPYTGLLSALANDPMLLRFELGRAAEIAPNLPGGLNLEGLTAKREGGVLIGFRNPVPDGLALILGLSNPVEMALDAAAPKFDAVHQIDLGEGRGVRGLSEWRGRYLILGGSPTYTTVSRLYTWDGHAPRVTEVEVDLKDYNPEAFFTPEEHDLIMVLSDDGSVQHGETWCKHLPNDVDKRFRGVWLALPEE